MENEPTEIQNLKDKIERYRIALRLFGIHLELNEKDLNYFSKETLESLAADLTREYTIAEKRRRNYLENG